MELLKIIFNCHWEFFSPDWEKYQLNSIGNGALFRPLRHTKKIPEVAHLIQSSKKKKKKWHSVILVEMSGKAHIYLYSLVGKVLVFGSGGPGFESQLGH